MHKGNMNKSGFSLIEVLIFVSILGVFFVAAAATTIYTLRTAQISEHKILATRYADDLMEWLRSEKEGDWNAFISKYVPNSSSANVFCFNKQIIGASAIATSCGYDGILNGNIYSYQKFKREVNLTGSTTQVNVAVLVSWQEYGQTFTVPLNAIFKQAE